MKNAIIVHGRPSRETYYSSEYPTSANFAWIPWLKKELMVRDIKTDTPEMPHAYEPDYDIWKRELERFDINESTILVGHSAGGGFLVRYLSENSQIKINKLFLVAPSIDPYHKSKTAFGEFNIDKDLAKRCTIIILKSDSDSDGVMKSISVLTETIRGSKVVTFPGYGHFIPQHMNDSVEFPELLELIINE